MTVSNTSAATNTPSANADDDDDDDGWISWQQASKT